jgi:hypothetical protein
MSTDTGSDTHCLLIQEVTTHCILIQEVTSDTFDTRSDSILVF